MFEDHISNSPALREIEHELNDHQIDIKKDVNLSSFTYLRTGGTASLIIYPRTVDNLSVIIGILSKYGQAYKVIGNTSNLLFRDEANYAVLISTMRMNRIEYDGNTKTITAECGVMMPELSRVALWNSAKGFEGLEGIPGTIGGGIFMNAGAYGTELKDQLIGGLAVRPDGCIEEVTPEELGLTHRASALRRGQFSGIVAQCTFRATQGDAQKIFHEMEVFHAKRHKYQDFMYPNLGSIFSGSPYRALAAKDKKFKLISALFYLFRYEYKIFHRESPLNRKWLNDIVLQRFEFDYKLQPFSDKTLNCLVNRGQGTDEMIRFIRQLEDLIAGRVPLENEIVEGF